LLKHCIGCRIKQARRRKKIADLRWSEWDERLAASVALENEFSVREKHQAVRQRIEISRLAEQKKCLYIVTFPVEDTQRTVAKESIATDKEQIEQTLTINADAARGYHFSRGPLEHTRVVSLYFLVRCEFLWRGVGGASQPDKRSPG